MGSSCLEDLDTGFQEIGEQHDYSGFAFQKLYLVFMIHKYEESDGKTLMLEG